MCVRGVRVAGLYLLPGCMAVVQKPSLLGAIPTDMARREEVPTFHWQYGYSQPCVFPGW